MIFPVPKSQTPVSVCEQPPSPGVVTPSSPFQALSVCSSDRELGPCNSLLLSSSSYSRWVSVTPLGNTWSESTQSSQNLCYTKRILKVFTLEIHKITLHLGPHAHVRESTQLPRQHLRTTAQGTPDLYAKVYLNPEDNKNSFNFFTLSGLARNILLLWVPVFIFAFFFVHESLFLLLCLWYCSLFIKTHWLKERQKTSILAVLA